MLVWVDFNHDSTQRHNNSLSTELDIAIVAPDDLASSCLHLLVPLATFITGQSMRPNDLQVIRKAGGLEGRLAQVRREIAQRPPLANQLMLDSRLIISIAADLRRARGRIRSG